MAVDFSQWLIIEDPQTCVAVAAEASELEQAAMCADREGRINEAIHGYRHAAVKLEEAARLCLDGHPDQGVLLCHADEVIGRALYLGGASVGSAVPLEEHIRGAQLTLGLPPDCSQEIQELSIVGHSSSSRTAPSRTKVMGAAAMLSGAAGIIIVGPMAGVALGAATAYATTRGDQAGSAARTVGRAGVRLVDQAKTIEKDHRIGQRVVTVSLSVTVHVHFPTDTIEIPPMLSCCLRRWIQSVDSQSV